MGFRRLLGQRGPPWRPTDARVNSRQDRASVLAEGGLRDLQGRSRTEVSLVRQARTAAISGPTPTIFIGRVMLYSRSRPLA